MPNGRDTSWHAEARRLSQAGLSHIEIGRRLGYTRSAVYKALNPDRAKKWWDTANRLHADSKLEWHRAHLPRATCDACGMPAGSTASKPTVTRCTSCIRAVADARASIAEGMWAEGWPLREMAEVFGVRVAYFSVRRIDSGWNLPYRYRRTKRQRTAAA